MEPRISCGWTMRRSRRRPVEHKRSRNEVLNTEGCAGPETVVDVYRRKMDQSALGEKYEVEMKKLDVDNEYRAWSN